MPKHNKLGQPSEIKNKQKREAVYEKIKTAKKKEKRERRTKRKKEIEELGDQVPDFLS
jgi:hypothetical protein